MRRNFIFLAALALSACTATGTPVVTLPPISPARLATDIATFNAQANGLLTQFGTSLTPAQKAQIQADLADLTAIAPTLAAMQPLTGTTQQKIKAAVNDVLAVASNPTVAALVPLPDQEAYSLVITGLNITVPIVEADVDGLIAAQTPTATPPPASP